MASDLVVNLFNGNAFPFSNVIKEDLLLPSLLSRE